MVIIGTEIVTQKLEDRLGLHLWQSNEHTLVREIRVLGGRSVCSACETDAFISVQCPATTCLSQEVFCGDLLL